MKYTGLIIITAFIFICLFFGLNKTNQNLKSPLLNKPIPDIAFPYKNKTKNMGHMSRFINSMFVIIVLVVIAMIISSIFFGVQYFG